MPHVSTVNVQQFLWRHRADTSLPRPGKALLTRQVMPPIMPEREPTSSYAPDNMRQGTLCSPYKISPERSYLGSAV